MKIEIERQERAVVICPQGRLDVDSASGFLGAVDGELRRRGVERVRVDLGRLDYIDSAGAAVLIEGYRHAHKRGLKYTLRNLTEDVRRIFALTEGAAMLEPAAPVAPRGPGFIEWLGAEALSALKGVRDFSGLVLEIAGILARAPFSKRKLIRWDLAALYMERTGWDAIPIVAVIAFLVGIVLALQSATQLARYGALIFVADLVAISLTRELGPLITAIIMAGRSGSAFAAEIGTMKVNEEIDALKTMGLSPVAFLAVPKFVALTVMMPCLVVLANAVGIFGGFLLGIANLGLAPGVYIEQTVNALQMKDVVTGLIKSVVFAMLIASTGCFRGFEVEGGADGVGRKTTASVVTSIFLVILADAAFTALFYVLD